MNNSAEEHPATQTTRLLRRSKKKCNWPSGKNKSRPSKTEKTNHNQEKTWCGWSFCMQKNLQTILLHLLDITNFCSII